MNRYAKLVKGLTEYVHRCRDGKLHTLELLFGHSHEDAPLPDREGHLYESVGMFNLLLERSYPGKNQGAPLVELGEVVLGALWYRRAGETERPRVCGP